MKKPAKVKPLFWIIFGVIILILVAAVASTGQRPGVQAGTFIESRTFNDGDSNSVITRIIKRIFSGRSDLSSGGGGNFKPFLVNGGGNGGGDDSCPKGSSFCGDGTTWNGKKCVAKDGGKGNVCKGKAGFKCCGSVSRLDDKECSFGTCIPEDQQCLLRCLSADTSISTPSAVVNVKNLEVGMLVWTQDKYGNRVAAPIIKLNKIPAPNHQVVHLVLADGRQLWVSPSHPDANGNFVGNLKVGDIYDGSTVVSANLMPYKYDYTYDLLPAGDTSYYWANGILMGSTLK